MPRDQRTTIRALFRACPPDTVLYTGKIDVIDCRVPVACAGAGAAVVAFVVRPDERRATLWIDPAVIPAARYRLVELWARRVLGAGARCALLDADDLRAAPGLFDAPS